MFENYKSIKKTNLNILEFIIFKNKKTPLILCPDEADIIFKHRSNRKLINCYKDRKGKICNHCKKSDPEKRFVIFARDVLNNNKLGKIELSETQYMLFYEKLKEYRKEKYFIFSINNSKFDIDNCYWSNSHSVG